MYSVYTIWILLMRKATAINAKTKNTLTQLITSVKQKTKEQQGNFVSIKFSCLYSNIIFYYPVFLATHETPAHSRSPRVLETWLSIRVGHSTRSSQQILLTINVALNDNLWILNKTRHMPKVLQYRSRQFVEKAVRKL